LSNFLIKKTGIPPHYFPFSAKLTIFPKILTSQMFPLYFSHHFHKTPAILKGKIYQ